MNLPAELQFDILEKTLAKQTSVYDFLKRFFSRRFGCGAVSSRIDCDEIIPFCHFSCDFLPVFYGCFGVSRDAGVF